MSQLDPSCNGYMYFIVPQTLTIASVPRTLFPESMLMETFFAPWLVDLKEVCFQVGLSLSLSSVS